MKLPIASFLIVAAGDLAASTLPAIAPHAGVSSASSAAAVATGLLAAAALGSTLVLRATQRLRPAKVS